LTAPSGTSTRSPNAASRFSAAALPSAPARRSAGGRSTFRLFGGLTVRPEDLVAGNSDGLVVIEQDKAEEVSRAAVERRRREQTLFEELFKGRTTLELLGLPDVSDEVRNR
jgi:4-hydroxy-4-methyl-2-oxoglutarate aldolase